MKLTLKDLKKEYQRISGEVIPTMMSEMGLAELKLQDGSHLKVSTTYRATITEETRKENDSCVRTLLKTIRTRLQNRVT